MPRVDQLRHAFGKKNFLELYAVFSTPVLYHVETANKRELGSLEQSFVDRLVEEMSAFLLGGRAWLVEAIDHRNRIVRVAPAPRGRQPSWGGFLPQFLGFELSQEMRAILVDDADYPYLDAQAREAVERWRGELGPLLRRSGQAIPMDGSTACWWTFAGGKVNDTLKYGFEVSEGWKVIADNFQLRIQGNGVGHESVRAAIARMAPLGFWEAPEMRRAVLARLPGYRLSKFQDCLPERFALEVIERYLLDVEATVRWLRSVPTSPSFTELTALADDPATE